MTKVVKVETHGGKKEERGKARATTIQGKPVEMAPPDDPLTHSIGNVAISLESLIMCNVRELGNVEVSCALCNWRQKGPETVMSAFSQYHIEVMHHMEYNALKPVFKRVKESWIKREEQQREQAALNAKEAKAKAEKMEAEMKQKILDEEDAKDEARGAEE